MSSKVSSREGLDSSSGSKGVLEVPYEDAKLTVNMTHILDILIHDNVKRKREIFDAAAAELQRAVDERARVYKDEKINIEYLASKIKNTTDEDKKKQIIAEKKRAHAAQNNQRISVQIASKNFKVKVAEIKKYLENKGFHDLDSKAYTLDEIKAIAEPLNKIP